jgi:hypothetical protein
MPNLIKAMSWKKIPERRFGLRSSDKELPERRPGAFHHKNTLSYTHITEKVI